MSDKKTIFVLGNPDLEGDSLPLRIMPELKKKFPDIDFKIYDPNEEIVILENLVVIDTVVGIDEAVVFEGLEGFSKTPRVTMHDFDALSSLKMLKKLGKIKEIKIIGLPAQMPEKEAVEAVALTLSSENV